MFSDFKRSAGILLHISSLPSEYGIGTLGKAALRFADFLEASGQRFWQLLPLGHTGYGDSPYQSFSAFAGNPYFIDPELLADEGLVSRRSLERLPRGDGRYVDYGELYRTRFSLLSEAAGTGWSAGGEELSSFLSENEFWLPDYSLFMALKRLFGGAEFTKWPDRGAALRSSDAPDRWRARLRDDIRTYTFAQFLFFRQYRALKRCCGEHGVYIIGDVPIYTAQDSADVWSHPENYLLDGERRPVCVAGVPPDAFSKTGQLWGNPIYNWDAMERDGFLWWRHRLAHCRSMFDLVRLDHFRGLESYYAVAGGDSTAERGTWHHGPGSKLLDALFAGVPGLSLIAEDLGIITDEVRSLRDKYKLPGMSVLQFAFDGSGKSSYLPCRSVKNSVCYTGTHDNMTLTQFLEAMPVRDKAFLKGYLGDASALSVLRAGLESRSQLFIAPMQDYLFLGGEARMNTPGTALGNWRWRVRESELTDELSRRLRSAALRSGRL